LIGGMPGRPRRSSTAKATKKSKAKAKTKAKSPRGSGGAKNKTAARGRSRPEDGAAAFESSKAAAADRSGLAWSSSRATLVGRLKRDEKIFWKQGL